MTETAGAPLRRDDKGEGGCLRPDWLLIEKTADPSTSVGMTKGEGGASV